MIKKIAKKIRKKVVKKTEEINALDLLDKTLCELVVVNPNLTASGPISYGHLFPERIVLISVRAYHTDRMYVTYFSGGKTFSSYVPNDFKFKAVESGKLLEAYGDFLIKNLSSSLAHQFLIGSDPEMFVEDENSKVIPAFNFLGSKEKPNKTFPNEHGNVGLYWDGFQAEFETKANNCLGWQTDSVYCGIKGLFDAAKKHNPKSKLSIKTTMDIDDDLLKVSAEEHVQFGCMPSFNAYGMKGLTLSGREVPFRSAGGHIHYGLGMMTHEQAIPIVKALDTILAVACVSLFAKFDDVRRRSMYGLAGEYRLPPHGLEYRVLSNAWMCHPAIMNLVFDTSRKVLMFGKQGLLQYWKHDEAQTIEIINTCDVKAARKSLELNADIFYKIIQAAYGGLRSTKSVQGVKAFLIGMENVIETPDDIEKNWLVRPKDIWVAHANAVGKSWNSASDLIQKGYKVG